MFEEFMIRAMLGGVFLSLASGPVGCFILWKRLAYFGDTLAHSALLGVAMALFLGMNTVFAVFLLAMGISLLLILLRRMNYFSTDAVLGILSHSTLAIGLIIISVAFRDNVQMNSLLFGDILALNWSDVLISAAVSAIILIILISQWHSLIANTISSQIALVENIGSRNSEIVFMALSSGLVAIAMKITGVLLISALLILPAAIARIFAGSPERMAVFAAIFGALSVIGGLFLSLVFDYPAGPAIIVVAACGLFLSLILSRLLSQKNSI